MKNKSILKILDLTVADIQYLLHLSYQLKKNPQTTPPTSLTKKIILLLFQKDSTRTRCSFEVAAHQLGIKTVFIGATGSQFGTKESVADSARVFGGYFDGIAFRGFKHSDAEVLAWYSRVPVWNALTDSWHPLQVLADMLTIKEKLGVFKHKKIVFVGDAQNNVAHSLMVIASKLGMHYVVLSPQQLQPDPVLLEQCRQLTQQSGGSITITTDWKLATSQADVIYTDVWVSMGADDWKERVALLHPFQVNMQMINNAQQHVLFMHCLPAFHDLQTTIGSAKAKEYGSLFPAVAQGEFEVQDVVFQSAHSVVFTQAQNRMHVTKAILWAGLADEKVEYRDSDSEDETLF